MQDNRKQREAWWYRDRAKGAEERRQSLVQNKIAIFFWESHSDLLIDHHGNGLFARDLPISDELANKIEARRLEQECSPMAPMSAPRPAASLARRTGMPYAVGVALDQIDSKLQARVHQGYKLAAELKRELPDWTICYASAFADYLDPVGNFCPEVLLDGSRGPCPISGWRGLRMHPNFTASTTTEKLKARLTSPRHVLSQANIDKYAGNLPAWWHDNLTDQAIAQIELFQTKKVVTLYCEYGSDNLTDFQGHEIFANYLPITGSLVKRIRKWCRWLDKLGQEQALADGPVNWKPFVDEGYHIAVAIKRELPDWTVSYADEFKTYLAPGGYFCPEVLEDGSLGPCIVDDWKGKVAADRWNTFIG